MRYIPPSNKNSLLRAVVIGRLVLPIRASSQDSGTSSSYYLFASLISITRCYSFSAEGIREHYVEYTMRDLNQYRVSRIAPYLRVHRSSYPLGHDDSVCLCVWCWCGWSALVEYEKWYVHLASVFNYVQGWSNSRGCRNNYGRNLLKTFENIHSRSRCMSVNLSHRRKNMISCRYRVLWILYLNRTISHMQSEYRCDRWAPLDALGRMRGMRLIMPRILINDRFIMYGKCLDTWSACAAARRRAGLGQQSYVISYISNRLVLCEPDLLYDGYIELINTILVKIENTLKPTSDRHRHFRHRHRELTAGMRGRCEYRRANKRTHHKRCKSVGN